MLRVGLTGGLGSGKSTVAAMFATLGAHVLSADEIGRALMQPGEAVYEAIVARFGPQVVQPDGNLDRAALARIAFAGGRVEELNAIVHPATIARQEALAQAIFAQDPGAIVVVESALIFETLHSADWHNRFDRLVLVTAAESTKIARFIARSVPGDPATLEAEAKRRLARMIPDADKITRCDFVISNEGSLEQLQSRTQQVWQALKTK